jgi:alkylation response protein AidB-like acyl-CoA dehydrogenase
MQTISIPRRATPDALIASASLVARQAAERAPEVDADATFPVEDVASLHQAGLLRAPWPLAFEGEGLATGTAAARTLYRILRILGTGSLPLGRLYEGHVNAAALIARHGKPHQIAFLAQRARHGALFGVWNTDDTQASVRLIAKDGSWRLEGRKILCSGAGYIERPLVTAKDDAGRLLMVVPKVSDGERADLSAWTAQGMRGSATGTVDFTGLCVGADEIIGEDEDYHRQPAFSGGAWRFAAVHQGGMEALLDLCRAHLARTGRGGDPHQSARLGHAAMAVETARLWVERAALLAETGDAPDDAIVAYANLARLVVERAALDLIELVQRSVGLASFMRPNPIERISRDLATYLRQPAPDRALTSAAAWVLGQDEAASELWP